MSDSREPSVATVATTIHQIEHAVLLRGNARVRIANHQDPSNPPGLFFLRGVTAPRRRYGLTDVVLDPRTALLLHNGVPIPDAAHIPPGFIDTTARAKLIVASADEDAVIAYTSSHTDYRHWLTLCLPAIHTAIQAPRDRPLRLAMPPLSHWQEDLLRLLGHDHVPRLILRPEAFYRLPHAEFSEFLRPVSAEGVSPAVHEVAARIARHLPDPPAPRDILFIPNPDADYGPMQNETEVRWSLAEHRIRVLPHGLPTAQRINAFRAARAVIGPSGPAMADIVFCRPGTLVWEWLPNHWQDNAIARLAEGAGLDYWADIFASESASGVAAPWSVSPAVLAQRLTEIAARPAASVPPRQRPTFGGAAADLLNRFESLGDNCEFGLVQLLADTDPLGLFRFAGVPLDLMLTALRTRLSGIDPNKLDAYLAGTSGRREWMVIERSLTATWHTGLYEGEKSADEVLARIRPYVTRLREKALSDLETGEKIWVWRESNPSDVVQVRAILDELRSFGPNRLLWVVQAADPSQIGTVERIDADFVKGHVEHLTSYADARNIRPASWYSVCEQADALLRRPPGD